MSLPEARAEGLGRLSRHCKLSGLASSSMRFSSKKAHFSDGREKWAGWKQLRLRLGVNRVDGTGVIRATDVSSAEERARA